ncbi:hypothetical protein FQN60_009240 [Etheostoma spectabile]|uniref:Uncharacterized protein n=1 Tax=Etheostoma spectabile TaxID=54343 RepID=A0A5J5CAY3_9PERO|nr:hypothetical protein FQN60_009240 [Etheostoma spectabile]
MTRILSLKRLAKLGQTFTNGQTELESSRLAIMGGPTKSKRPKVRSLQGIEGEFVQQTLPWRIPLEAQDKTSKPKQNPERRLGGHSKPSLKGARRIWNQPVSEDSLCPERKRTRVDKMAIKKSSWVSICCARAFQRKSVKAFQSRAIKENICEGPADLPPEAQKEDGNNQNESQSHHIFKEPV